MATLMLRQYGKSRIAICVPVEDFVVMFTTYIKYQSELKLAHERNTVILQRSHHNILHTELVYRVQR